MSSPDSRPAALPLPSRRPGPRTDARPPDPPGPQVEDVYRARELHTAPRRLLGASDPSLSTSGDDLSSGRGGSVDALDLLLQQEAAAEPGGEEAAAAGPAGAAEEGAAGPAAPAAGAAGEDEAGGEEDAGLLRTAGMFQRILSL